MKAPVHLWLDQYGQRVYARTVKELREQVGGGAVSKIYVDKISGPHAGKAVHVGYVIGERWFKRFAPVEVVESGEVQS